MDSQNSLHSAALRQHSINLMAAFTNQAAAALPFLSAAAGVPIPSAVTPTATFVNFPVAAAGTPTTGTLESYTTQPIVYPSAYLTQPVCSCGCAAQPCHHRYASNAFLAASMANALSREATSTRIQSQQHPQPPAPSLSTLAPSNVNVNIPPPMAQLPPAPLNLPALPPTFRTSSSRALKRPAPYPPGHSGQSSHHPTSHHIPNLQPYGNSSSQDPTSSSGIRGPKLRRVASFDTSNDSRSSINPNETTTTQQALPPTNVPSSALFNQRAVDLADVAVSIDSVLQSTAQALPPAPYSSCNICAGCQTRLPPHPTCGCHHHHHCVNHHTICAVCSSAQNYGSGSSGSTSSSNATVNAVNAAYLASLSGGIGQGSQHSLPVQRQPEINPVHSSLLAQRQAQQERDQQSANVWYQRQFNQSLIGFDVVTRRLPQPVIMMPRLPPTMMDLSIFVLHPTDAVLSGAAGIQAAHQHANSEPQPVGATLDQIKKFTSTINYVKKPEAPEHESERCTICLVEFEQDEAILSLPCNHIFHVECSSKWLQISRKCPICRMDIAEGNYSKIDKASISNIIEATIPSHSSQYART